MALNYITIVISYTLAVVVEEQVCMHALHIW
jgi:hypothetical protein